MIERDYEDDDKESISELLDIYCFDKDKDIENEE